MVFARRAADGQPDAGSIAAACTENTRAVVIVSPDNPLGVVSSRDVLGQVAGLCRERHLTLIADHCLAPVNPWGRHIPLLPRVASMDLEWIAVADTGKILGLNGSKIAALACSPRWQAATAAAASRLGFQHALYDLALLAEVLPRSATCRAQVNLQIRANYEFLRARVPEPLAVAPVDAGCFALVDARGLGLNDTRFAELLRDQHKVVAVPVSWFPAGQPARETRVRVSLSRRPEVIEKLAAALNALARDLA